MTQDETIAWLKEQAANSATTANEAHTAATGHDDFADSDAAFCKRIEDHATETCGMAIAAINHIQGTPSEVRLNSGVAPVTP